MVILKTSFHKTTREFLFFFFFFMIGPQKSRELSVILFVPSIIELSTVRYPLQILRRKSLSILVSSNRSLPKSFYKQAGFLMIIAKKYIRFRFLNYCKLTFSLDHRNKSGWYLNLSILKAIGIGARLSITL